MKITTLHRRRMISAAVALAGGLVLAVSLQTTLAADEPASSASVVVTAITKPSKELKLAFAAPGVVQDVAVKEGDAVDAKQVLASQDSRQDELELQSLQLKATDTYEIQYNALDKKLKENQLKRKKYLLDHDHSAAESEVEDAQGAVDLANARVGISQSEHTENAFAADKQKVKVDQMKILSPIKGIVEKLNVGPGEMADPQSKDGAVVVGQWDPLWLEMHLPSVQATQLKLNQELAVKYDGSTWQMAKIIYFEKVDAASDTEMVRMELANPGEVHLPGLHMQVKLPEVVAAVTPGT